MSSFYIPRIVEKKEVVLVSEGFEGFLNQGLFPYIPKLVCESNQGIDAIEQSDCEMVLNIKKGETIQGENVKSEEKLQQTEKEHVVPQKISEPEAVNPLDDFSSLDGQLSKKINQVTYAVLAIFLGGIGAHKFYAGKMGLGIVYLLFCWTFIPVLVGLIEGVIAFTKKSDSNGNIEV